MSTPQPPLHNLVDLLPDSAENSATPEDFRDAEEDEKNVHKIILAAAKAKRYRWNTNLRLFLAFWAVSIVSTWMWKVGEIVVNNHECYHLSDNVLIALLSTTTIEVIAIVLIAMRDLFGGKSEDGIK